MKKTSKPSCNEAMQLLTHQIRETIPFDIPISVLCTGVCHGCSKKLIDYLDTEVLHWESVLRSEGEIKLGDVSRLAKTSKKIYNVLKKNGIIV
ncbi:hypothetical protein [Nitrincola nitratireducens]|uniref:hypothetical protein n=1 Tax=Nitrincola nitratireducens TaxID=1229521 RepID=UPI0012F80633|nr:hypothetical protein [Nitrincola nitratireducens]